MTLYFWPKKTYFMSGKHIQVKKYHFGNFFRWPLFDPWLTFVWPLEWNYVFQIFWNFETRPKRCALKNWKFWAQDQPDRTIRSEMAAKNVLNFWPLPVATVTFGRYKEMYRTLTLKFMHSLTKLKRKKCHLRWSWVLLLYCFRVILSQNWSCYHKISFCHFDLNIWDLTILPFLI